MDFYTTLKLYASVTSPNLHLNNVFVYKSDVYMLA